MYGSSEEHPQGENVFYYLTVYNEPTSSRPSPTGSTSKGLLKGLYRYAEAPEVDGEAPGAQILASGVGVPWALEAQRMLAEEWGVAADVWSATSWTELRREALACDEWNLRTRRATARPARHQARRASAGPVVARVSDFMRAVPDQIAPWVPGDWSSLGTDGFGFSDTRRRRAGSSTSTRPRSRSRC